MRDGSLWNLAVQPPVDIGNDDASDAHGLAFRLSRGRGFDGIGLRQWIDEWRDHPRFPPRDERQRAEAAGRPILVDGGAAAIVRKQHDLEPLRRLVAARRQHPVRAHRRGPAPGPEIAVVVDARVFRRPQPDRVGAVALGSVLDVEASDRAVDAVVVRGEGADDAIVVGELLGLDERRRIDGLVAKPEGHLAPVRILRPERLAVGQIPVHIAPARVEDAPVGQRAEIEVGQRIGAQSAHVPAIRVHHVQMRTGPRLADRVVARRARGDEGDPTVGKVDRTRVVRIRRVRQRPQIASGDVHLVDLPSARPVAAHREEHLLRVKGERQIVEDRVGFSKDRLHALPGTPDANRASPCSIVWQGLPDSVGNRPALERRSREEDHRRQLTDFSRQRGILL